MATERTPVWIGPSEEELERLFWGQHYPWLPEQPKAVAVHQPAQEPVRFFSEQVCVSSGPVVRSLPVRVHHSKTYVSTSALGAYGSWEERPTWCSTNYLEAIGELSTGGSSTES